jgi:hypothetical protein
VTEYATTDVVPVTREYICTACGEATEFEAGDDFAVCGSCGDEEAGWNPLEDELEAGTPAATAEEDEFSV